MRRCYDPARLPDGSIPPLAVMGGAGRMETELSFAEALRQHGRERGLTQAELAERAHLSERAISDLERGLKSPQRATMRLLAEGLGLPLDEAHGLEAKI